MISNLSREVEGLAQRSLGNRLTKVLCQFQQVFNLIDKKSKVNLVVSPLFFFRIGFFNADWATKGMQCLSSSFRKSCNRRKQKFKEYAIYPPKRAARLPP